MSNFTPLSLSKVHISPSKVFLLFPNCRKMSRKNPLNKGKSSFHQTNLGRSSRYLSREDDGNKNPTSKNKQVRHSTFSANSRAETTSRRRSVRLMGSVGNKENVVSGSKKPGKCSSFHQTNLRRSPRFLIHEDNENKKPTSKNKQACHSSPCDTPNSRTETASRRRCVRLMGFLENKKNVVVGSKKLGKPQVLQSLRRSPRFTEATNGLESYRKLEGRKPTRKNEGWKYQNSVSTDLLKNEVRLDASQQGNCKNGRSNSDKLRFSNARKSGETCRNKVGRLAINKAIKQPLVTEFSMEHRRITVKEDSVGSVGTSVGQLAMDNDIDKEFKQAVVTEFRKDDSRITVEGDSVGSVGISETVGNRSYQLGIKKRGQIERGNGEIRNDTMKGVQCRKGRNIVGWTKDQEAALHRAYLAAKPSPHFWKKVAKMVPGKSSQECFDRIHYELVTPPQPQPRSRTKRTLSPLGHFSLSTSEVLKPIDVNVQRTRGGKRKSLLAQKTVRHLLRKHQVVEKQCEADLFSVLEATTSSSDQGLAKMKVQSTPDSMTKPSCFLPQWYDKPSAHEIMLSAVKNSHQADLISPLVLKKVKNMAMHEKYIDQLHSREAKRKRTDSAPATKETCQSKADVKAARIALASDADDFIKHFQQMQSVSLFNVEDFDADDVESDENDCEDDLL